MIFHPRGPVRGPVGGESGAQQARAPLGRPAAAPPNSPGKILRTRLRPEASGSSRLQTSKPVSFHFFHHSVELFLRTPLPTPTSPCPLLPSPKLGPSNSSRSLEEPLGDTDTSAVPASNRKNPGAPPGCGPRQRASSIF